MIDRHNFDRHRDANFSIAVNSPPTSAEAVGAELDRYSAGEASAVALRARREAGFHAVMDALLPLSEIVLSRQAESVPDLEAEQRATARYLRRLVPLIKMTDRMLDGQWSSPNRATTLEELRAEVERLRQRVDLGA
jgi:hypothetical protein